MSEFDHRRGCLARVPVFAGLDDATLDQVAAVATTGRYGRRERITGPGDRAALYVVHHGMARVSRIAPSGSGHLLRMLAPGDFVGETAVFTGEAGADLVETVQETEVCRLAASDMRRFLESDPGLAARVVSVMAQRLRRVEDRLSSGSTASVARRLADHLLLLATEQGDDAVTLPSTKKDLAAWLGTSPETLSRRLGRFQDDGLIRLLHDGRIALLDRRGLESVPDT